MLRVCDNIRFAYSQLSSYVIGCDNMNDALSVGKHWSVGDADIGHLKLYYVLLMQCGGTPTRGYRVRREIGF